MEETLARLTLEKKVAQLICADIAGEYRAESDSLFQRWLGLARNQGLGMFVLYGGTPRDVAHLLNRLQEEAEVPILISADFEGGPGQQVVGASEFPANMAFSAAGSDELMYRAASAAAVEGRALGAARRSRRGPSRGYLHPTAESGPECAFLRRGPGPPGAHGGGLRQRLP